MPYQSITVNFLPALYTRRLWRCFVPTLLGGFFLLATTGAMGQVQQLRYAINRHGKKVGELQLKQVKTGTQTVYNVASEVNVRMLLHIQVKASEQSVYENDLLQSSQLHRTVNGKQKLSKQLRNNGKGLVIAEEGEEDEVKNVRVRYGMHCLYVQEPLLYTNVFSDNYETFVPIVKLADHRYKITFPDGNSNEYHYENGVCKKVVVRSTLFDAEFLLVSR